MLVTGACGLLGAHLVEVFRPHAQVAGLDRNPWWGDRPLDLRAGDLADHAFLKRVVADVRPDVLIHCAALVDVDRCERRPAEAFAINSDVTRVLASAAAPETLFVYVSTDSIFKADRPFSTERDLPCPRTVYARSKLHGEWETQLSTSNHLIIRTNLYGWSSGRKKTFAEWLYESLRTAAPITLFDDLFYTPIYVVDLAERILALCRGAYRGVVHLAAGDRVSKLEFGLAMAELAGLPATAVRPGRLKDAALSADRPSEISLDTRLSVQLTGLPAPAWRDGLIKFLAARGRPLSARMTARAAGSGASGPTHEGERRR